MTPLQPLLTTGEVATALAVDPETVRRWVKDGKLSVVVLPSGVLRFKRADIDRILGDEPVAEAGRVDVETVVSVLAVITALTLGLNFVGPHVQASLIVLSLAIGALTFYATALHALPLAAVQPRRGATRPDHRLGPGHCCACSVVCHHIGPVSLCAGHAGGTPVTDTDAVRLVEDVIDATSDIHVGSARVPTTRTAAAIVAALRDAGWQP